METLYFDSDEDQDEFMSRRGGIVPDAEDALKPSITSRSYGVIPMEDIDDLYTNEAEMERVLRGLEDPQQSNSMPPASYNTDVNNLSKQQPHTLSKKYLKAIK